ncbi:MAG: M48 family metalloprotease, partial [bacterium]|nr:M48 family metalloprotease [bacterium]
MFALISSAILLLMYFAVFILTSMIVFFSGISGIWGLTISFIITLLFILIQFFISPIIYDFMLTWLYRCDFVSVDELPKSIAEFVKKTFNDKGVRLPRIGIIDDYTPTAFTYGNFPSNARVIISRGLLDIMDEEEAKAVLAHEFGHVFHYDFVFMTLAAIIPILLYYIYRIALEMGQSSRRNGAPLYMIALVTYIIYIVSEYIVLYLSRLREYYADRFAAYLTMNPSALATALVKVGYGLLSSN